MSTDTSAGPVTAVDKPRKKKSELTLPERAALALSSPKAEAELKALIADSANIKRIKNKDGREECHSALMRLKSARINVEKVAKTAREDAQKFSKAVIEEEKRLVAIVTPEETRLQGIRDTWDEEQERIRQEQIRIERERIEAIQKKIADMVNLPLAMMNKSSAAIMECIRRWEHTEILETEYEEYTAEAVNACDDMLAKLRDLYTGKKAAEEEAERIRAERARQEEQRRIEEQRRKEEQERAAAELRRQQEETARVQRELAEQRRAMEAQQAELARQQAEMQRQQAEMEAKRRALEAPPAPPVAASTEPTKAPDDVVDAEFNTASKGPAVWPFPVGVVHAELAPAIAPTADEIVSVLADHYDESPMQVVHWLTTLNFVDAGERLTDAAKYG